MKIVVGVFLLLSGLADASAKSCVPERHSIVVGESTAKWDTLVPKKAPRANVLVLPGIGGAMIPDQWTARTLCKMGMQVLLFQGFSHGSDLNYDWDRQDRQTWLAVHTLQKIMDQYPGRYGLLGTSLGGIYGATLVGLDRRIEAAVLIAAGGDLASILVNSTQDEPRRFKAKVMEKYGIKDEAELETEWRSHIHLDPLMTADPKAKVKMLFAMNHLDHAVPTYNQKLLWKAWGKPKRINIPLDHISGISAHHLYSIAGWLGF